MSVTEAQRHRLYESLKAAIGVEEADIMMSLVPPTGWRDVVSKDDLRAEFAIFRSEVNTDFATFRSEVNADFAAFRAEMAAEFSAMRSEVAAESDQLRAEMVAGSGQLRAEMVAGSDQLRAEMASALHRQTRSLGTCLFASQAVVIAAIGLLLGVVH